MKSIRRRLFWLQLLTTAILVAVAAILVYIRVRASLLAQFDEALAGKAKALTNLIRVTSAGDFEAEYADSALPEFSTGRRPEYLQVQNAAGTILFRSRSLDGKSLLASSVSPLPPIDNLILPNGKPGRSIVLPFTPSLDDDDAPSLQPPTTTPAGLFLTLAQDRRELDERLESVLAALLLAGTILAVGIVGMTALTTQAGLSHLRRFAEDVRAIDVDTLSTRLDESEVPLEVSPISMRINALLSRLHIAFERERRFTADASHELRTPIAELRTLAEVAVRNTDIHGSPETMAFFRDALAISKQMESLVQTLLALARGQPAMRIEIMTSGGIFTTGIDIWKSVMPIITERKLQLTGRFEEAPDVRTDSAILSSILTNLFSNAAAHAKLGGNIFWRIGPHPRGLLIEVENDADSLTNEDLSRLTEPFWRKNTDRGSTEHCGLGLALVQSSARALDMELNLALPSPAILRATIVIPFNRLE